MKRPPTLVLLALLLVAGTVANAGNYPAFALGGRTTDQVTGAESLTVSPMEGVLSTTFTVTGSGFTPGSLMDEEFIDPTGARWQFSDWNTFNVEDDGDFGFTSISAKQTTRLRYRLGNGQYPIATTALRIARPSRS